VKKKIVTPMLAAAMLTAGKTNAYAASPLDGYAVTVYDQNTLAVFAAGKDWPITKWYFHDSDGDVLGSIENDAVMELSEKHQGQESINWEYWLPQAFNEYRGVGADIVISEQTGFDAEALMLEVIELTNAEREKHGLHPLEANDELMELAQIRAKEISRKYSHERPDGTRVSEIYRCGENIGARKTAAIQVEKWMASEGHRHNILLDRYESIGVGCYKSGTGRIYWVQIFKS